jgi:hypothetical protein
MHQEYLAGLHSSQCVDSLKHWPALLSHQTLGILAAWGRMSELTKCDQGSVEQPYLD